VGQQAARTDALAALAAMLARVSALAAAMVGAPL
jgi:hypothetical protein